MIVVAAMVKLRSKGPVFYKQDRIGQDNKPFKMLKFRTMHVAADPTIHQEFVTRFIKAGGAVEEPGRSGIPVRCAKLGLPRAAGRLCARFPLARTSTLSCPAHAHTHPGGRLSSTCAHLAVRRGPR